LYLYDRTSGELNVLLGIEKTQSGTIKFQEKCS
jgi:hypothetical protein